MFCIRERIGNDKCACGAPRPYRKWRCEKCQSAVKAQKKRRGRNWKNSWPIVLDFLFDLSGGKCGYCDAVVPEGQRTADHIVPLSRGGEHRAHNLIACCRSCNSRKADKTAEEFLAAS